MQSNSKATSSDNWLVEGMDCSGCKTKIEKALARVPGVVSSNVNFMSKQLTVDFDSEAVLPGQIERLVSGLGFVVTPVPNRGVSEGAVGARESGLNAIPAAQVKQGAALYWNAKARDVVLACFLLGGAWAASTAFRPVWIAATLLAGWPILRRAVSGARAGVPFSIESLMTVAAAGALLIGAMEEAAVVIVLFLVGEWLESVATAKARSGIQALVSLAPPTAWLLQGDRVREVAADSLIVGDLIQIRPGDRVPTDGTISEGESQLDESLLTGESLPVVRRPGEPVTAGTLNGDGGLVVRVQATTQNNTLARIQQLIALAEKEKSPTARFIDRFSRWYTPAVFALALLVAFVPPLVGGGELRTWVYRALGLLLIGCPCALVLSVPAAVTSSIARGTRMGLLVKGGAALESIGGVTVAAFDKTGTLTQGSPRLLSVVPTRGESREELLSLAASLEQASSHPLARALVAAAQQEGLPLMAVEEAKALPGRGVSGTVGGRRYAILSPRALGEMHGLETTQLARKDEEEDLGRTVVGAVDITDEMPVLKGLLSLSDTLRPDAAQAVSELKALGVHPVLLTGDNARAANVVATQLGIEVKSDLRPEEKLAALRELKSRGRVAMIGDGINDAPALAAADIGIAMGSGTGVAIESADAILHNDRVRGVVDLIRLSRRTRAIIVQNVTVALGLKGVFLVTTLLGITGLWLAVLSDTGATVLVTLNALRLLAGPRHKDTQRARK